MREFFLVIAELGFSDDGLFLVVELVFFDLLFGERVPKADINECCTVYRL